MQDLIERHISKLTLSSVYTLISFKVRQAVEKVLCIHVSYGGGGRVFWETIDQIKVRSYFTVVLAISNSEIFIGTHSTVVEALSFALFPVLHPFPALFLLL